VLRRLLTREDEAGDYAMRSRYHTMLTWPHGSHGEPPIFHLPLILNQQEEHDCSHIVRSPASLHQDWMDVCTEDREQKMILTISRVLLSLDYFRCNCRRMTIGMGFQ
jgi:hypothetical protein